MADAHAPERPLANGQTRIDFQTQPSRYRHWKLKVDGDIAFDLQLPMPVTRWLGLEVDPGLAVCQRTLGGMGVSHHSVPDMYYNSQKAPKPLCTIMHQTATPESTIRSPSW